MQTELNLSLRVSVIPQHKIENVKLVSDPDLESFQWMAKQETAD